LLVGGDILVNSPGSRRVVVKRSSHFLSRELGKGLGGALDTSGLPVGQDDTADRDSSPAYAGVTTGNARRLANERVDTSRLVSRYLTITHLQIVRHRRMAPALPPDSRPRGRRCGRGKGQPLRPHRVLAAMRSSIIALCRL